MKYLLVIDVQKDFVDGALGTKEALAIIPKVKEKIAEYKAEGGKVIFTRDTHSPDYMNTNEGRHLPVEHCIKGTVGWELYEGLDTDGAEIIDKPSFGFLGWDRYIQNASDLHIELIALCTDICVASNALILKAMFPEAEVSVDADASAGVSVESHLEAIHTMKMCQVEIKEG